MTDVVIITYNNVRHIGACLDSLQPAPGRTIVVDNASTDGTAELVEAHDADVELVRMPENQGYAGAVNAGVDRVAAEAVIVANADVEFRSGCIEGLTRVLESERAVAVAGPQQVFPDGRWQRSYGRVPGAGEAFANLVGMTTLHHGIRRLLWPRAVDRRPRDVGYIDGAVMAIRRRVFESVGGFDEGFFFFGEEADFCMRVRAAGWRVVFVPEARAMHVRGGSSRGRVVSDAVLRQLAESKARLVSKHATRRGLRLYLSLERLHARKMAIATHLLEKLAPEPKKERYATMASGFRRYGRMVETLLRDEGVGNGEGAQA